LSRVFVLIILEVKLFGILLARDAIVV
jgi:hypothetical protein